VILTRKVNNPELVFNQCSASAKFFRVNAEEDWQLSSSKGECFICDCHKYTAIFFNKGVVSKNNLDLQEIKDPQFLAQLGREYEADERNKGIFVPQIRGTVVSGAGYGKKLRMISTEVFGMLSVSECALVVPTLEASARIKTAIVKYAESDRVEVLKHIGAFDKLQGWRDVLVDKCLYNELSDVQVVNSDRIEDNLTSSTQTFVFAGYLAPGRHKFLIYCPQSKRAFIKSVMIGRNTKDFYPEFPKQIREGQKQNMVQNMWRSWKEDTTNRLDHAFEHDVKRKGFDLSPIVKDPVELEEVTAVLQDKFLVIKECFNQMMRGSASYPLLDWEAASQIVPPSPSIQVAQLELAFIRATRNQKCQGLKGTLCRCEFLDYVTRVAISGFPKLSPSLAVKVFVEQQLAPKFRSLTTLEVRAKIRDSPDLNKLLFKNRAAIEVVFEHNHGKKFAFNEA